MAQIPPKFSVTHHLDEKMWFVSGLLGGLNPAEGRMQLYRQNLKQSPAEQLGHVKITEIDLEFVADLRMSPATFKTIMLWMKKHVEDYEKSFGEIKMEPTEAASVTSDKAAYA
ncbi:MAG: hypothetical protein ABSA81_04320 [Candidatus Bathyarchaeia archaeon]